jgi:hypothetical protein
MVQISDHLSRRKSQLMRSPEITKHHEELMAKDAHKSNVVD